MSDASAIDDASGMKHVLWHDDLSTREVGISINGFNYGTAWNNLPDIVYPAVSIVGLGKYRMKERRG